MQQSQIIFWILSAFFGSAYFLYSYFYSAYFLFGTFCTCSFSICGLIFGIFTVFEKSNHEDGEVVFVPLGFLLIFGVILSSSFVLFGKAPPAYCNTIVSKIKTINSLIDNEIKCRLRELTAKF